jgi:TonB family protein
MSRQTPVAPVPIPPAERVRSFLGWAFIISIAAHFVLGGLMPYKQTITGEKEVEKVSVTKKTKIIVPTPPPTPTPPPPTPPPKQTPPPVTSTVPPQQPKLKLNVPKTTSKGNNSAAGERTYTQPKEGSEQGVPQGTVNSAPPAPTSGPATAPPPPPTPPPPRCAQPHKDATTTRAIEPDYPDLARQQGAVGTVLVRVSLSASAVVTDTRIYKSSGNAQLDKAALAAARASSYAAEVDDCQPAAGIYIFHVDFTGQ